MFPNQGIPWYKVNEHKKVTIYGFVCKTCLEKLGLDEMDVIITLDLNIFKSPKTKEGRR